MLSLSTIQICSPFGFSFVNPWCAARWWWLAMGWWECRRVRGTFLRIRLGCFSLLSSDVILLLAPIEALYVTIGRPQLRLSPHHSENHTSESNSDNSGSSRKNKQTNKQERQVCGRGRDHDKGHDQHWSYMIKQISYMTILTQSHNHMSKIWA